MKAALADRALVLWMAGSLVAWTCCLVIVWAHAMDASGATTLLAEAGALLAVALAAILPARAFQAAMRVAGWLNLGGAISTVLGSGPARGAGPSPAKNLEGVPGPSHTMARRGAPSQSGKLLAAVAIAAAAGGVGTTAAIVPAAGLVESLAGLLTLTPLGWATVKLAVIFACMLPIAVGTALVFLASTVVRSGPGSDPYAGAFRDWLWAGAGGLAAFAVSRRCGLDMLGLCWVMPLALLAGAMTALQWRIGAGRGGRAPRPPETPGVARRLAVAATFGLATLAGIAQLRLLKDMAGAGTIGAACWVAATLALLAAFLGKIDHKSRPPGRRQRAGAVIGLAAMALLQASLAISGIGRGGCLGEAGGGACFVLAGLSQVPMAALAAIVLSRQRRLFAYAGGRARGYLSSAACGAGAAIPAYLVCSWSPAGPPAMPPAAILLVVAAMAICAGGVMAGLRQARRAGRQLQWLAWGGVLMCALAAAVLGAVGHAAGVLGGATPGVWLTSLSLPARQADAVAGSQAAGPSASLLPAGPVWRSARIDRLLAGVIAGRSGHWLAGVDSPCQLPEPVPAGVAVEVALPDPTAIPAAPGQHPPRGPASLIPTGQSAGLYDYGYLRKARFDGVLLATAGGHPDAWRMCGKGTLARLMSCRQAGGVGVLRIQADDAGLAGALGAVKAFEEAAGAGEVFIDTRSGEADILVVAGPVSAPATIVPLGGEFSVEPEAGLLRARTGLLWYEWPHIRAASVLTGSGNSRCPVSVSDLVVLLGDARPASPQPAAAGG